MNRTNGHFYAVSAIDNATGREVATTHRAVATNAMRAARAFAAINPPVTVTVVRVETGPKWCPLRPLAAPVAA